MLAEKKAFCIAKKLPNYRNFLYNLLELTFHNIKNIESTFSREKVRRLGCTVTFVHPM